MARCEQGYLCEVCNDEVHDLTDSDLYLNYVLGLVDIRALPSKPERHIRCNPVQAQFIVDDRFEPVHVDGPFGKSQMDAAYVTQQEQFVTRGWQRLQEIPSLQLPISEYPLPEVRRPSTSSS